MNDDTDIGLDLTARWETVGVTVDALQVGKGGTIMPEIALLDTVHELELEATLAAADSPEGFTTSLGSSISVGETIGQGGMGLIRVATQHALRREVVVKSVRGDVDQSRATAHVVGEARVTGLLEHPNIIPIHDIALHTADEPMIVMKRIEGSAWSELIEADGPGGVSATSLDRHLEILRQVANAVHYAHSKGVVHRDLKPDNVMLGRFGEVYVLDWGIAVGLEGAPAGLPPASAITAVAGTPRYMAPEMVGVDGAAMGPATDVYLMGAILHELLTGRPPHQGDELVEVMASAFRSAPPAFPDHVDEGLAAVSRRALSRRPEDRYPSAEAFREALEAYQQRRGSRVLADQALDSLNELERWLDSPRIDVEDHGRQRAYELLSACRFGFNQALNDWTDNPEAREGLQRALVRMVHYELEVGSSRAAAALVAALPEPDPELSALAEAGAAKTRAAVARLQELEADADMTRGDRARSFMLLANAVGWAVAAVALGYLDRNGIWPIGHWEMIALWGLNLLTLLPLFGDVSWLIEPTRTNRALGQASVFSVVAYVSLWALGMERGWSVEHTLTINFLVGAFGWGTMAIVLDRWLALTAVELTVGALLFSVWPDFKFEIMGAAVVFGMGGTALAWGRRAQQSAAEDVG